MSEPDITNQPTKQNKKKSNKNLFIVIGVVALIVIVLVIKLTTDKSSDSIMESSNNKISSQSLDTLKESAEKAKEEREDINTKSREIPNDFAYKSLVYKDASVINFAKTSHSSANDEYDTYSVALKTRDQSTRIVDFYTKAFSSDGWKIEHQSGGKRGGTITAKNEAKGLTGSAIINNEKTTIPGPIQFI